MKILPLIVFAFLLATVAGWHTRAPVREASSTSENTRLSSRQARAHQKPRNNAIPANVAARLAPVSAAKTPADRLRAVIHLANTIPIAELAAWYDNRWFDSTRGAEAEVFAEITRHRWMAQDPEGLLDHAILRNSPALGDLAARWARLDPDRALAYLETVTLADDRIRLKMTMLGGFAESRPDVVLAEAASVSSFHDPHWDKWTNLVAKLARVHPSALDEAKLHPLLKTTAERAIATAALERDFNGELARHITTPEGSAAVVYTLQTNSRLAKSASTALLASFGSLPLEFLQQLSQSASSIAAHNSTAWLNTDLTAWGLDPRFAREFHYSAISSLVGSNPEEALRYLPTLGLGDNNSIELTARALLNLKATDPAKAADWQARLVANAPDQDFVTQLTAKLEPPPQKPAEKPGPITVAAILDYLKPRVDRTSAWNFAAVPPSVLREFEVHLKAMDPKDLAIIGRNSDTSELPVELQAPLLAAAIHHPRPNHDPRFLSGEENSAIRLGSEWVHDDPVAASRWAASLPEGQARLWTLRNLAANWAPYDTPAANAWIASLPAADQADLREFLKTGQPK